MDLKTLRNNAREKLQGYCLVCLICYGRSCAGSEPGRLPSFLWSWALRGL